MHVRIFPLLPYLGKGDSLLVDIEDGRIFILMFQMLIGNSVTRISDETRGADRLPRKQVTLRRRAGGSLVFGLVSAQGLGEPWKEPSAEPVP